MQRSTGLRRVVPAVLLTVLLGGCAAAPVSPETVAAGTAVGSTAPTADVPPPASTAEAPAIPALPLLKVRPSEFGAALQLNQRLRIRRGEERHELDAVLAIDATSVRLAVVGFGLRLITLGYDGERVDERRHPLLPAAVDGERILRDLVLTYWPLAALRARLPDGWTLDERDAERELSWRGRPVVRIRYQGASRVSGTAELHHLQHGYAIVIDSEEA